MLYEFNNALGDVVVINLPIEYKEKYSFYITKNQIIHYHSIVSLNRKKDHY